MKKDMQRINLDFAPAMMGPAVFAMVFFLLVITVTTVAAEEAETRTPESSPAASGDDATPSFRQGRQFLDQAWAALDRDNQELATRFFARAEERFSEALEDNPDNIDILMNRATSHMGTQNYDLVLVDFDRVLELDSGYAPAYEGKAVVYELMGDIESATEMRAVADSIYRALAQMQPDGQVDILSTTTFYASATRHNYTNRFTGAHYVNASGFGCGITEPWKRDVENAVYFSMPWSTWNRNSQGIFFANGTSYWVSLNGNLQGYIGSGAFTYWTSPGYQNYVILIDETSVCLGNMLAINSAYRITADY